MTYCTVLLQWICPTYLEALKIRGIRGIYHLKRKTPFFFFFFFFSYVVHSFINVFVCVWIKSSQKYIIQMKYWYNNLFFYVTPYPYTPYTMYISSRLMQTTVHNIISSSSFQCTETYAKGISYFSMCLYSQTEFPLHPIPETELANSGNGKAPFFETENQCFYISLSLCMDCSNFINGGGRSNLFINIEHKNRLHS